MGKKKKKKSLPPRRKRMTRDGRLRNARSTQWVENYTGGDLVRGYRNWYGVDALMAVMELRMLGVSVSEEREAQVRRTIEQKAAQTAARKERRRLGEEASFWEDRDENFAYIAGYTSGGAAFGVTWDEWEEMEF